MKPYGVISDTHHHNWSAFATVNFDGINSRLQTTLDETLRCAHEVATAGGDTIYHGGDLFHVRGSIAPSVLNPTIDMYRHIVQNMGIKIVINAGNHDLEGKNAHRVSSAITALEGVGCKVVNEPTIHHVGAGSDMAIVPWIPNIKALKEQLEKFDPIGRPNMDLLLHAPVDGILPGIPDHGLDGAYLASLGFRRVFAGHYHHHKEVAPGVWSIGSLTPQTWSDVGAKSGFLIVSDSGVNWRASRAPSFVEIDGTTDPAEIPLIVDGNYARVRIDSSKKSDEEAIRQFITDSGAAGVIVLPVKSVAAVARAGGAVLKPGATLEQSIGDFITMKAYAKPTELGRLCADILSTVRSAV